MENKFQKNGYIIIKNVISKKHLIDLKKVVNQSNIYSYELFLKKLKKNKKKLYDYVLPFHNEFLFHDLYGKILRQPKVLKALISLLGPDLTHHEDPSLAVNISNLDSNKRNYLFKNWHQELWSGASTSTVAFWTPIFLPKNRSGQIEFIPGSHLWGHIPHRNRKPISLPSKLRTYKINVNEGDIIFFHSLLLHKSTPVSSNTYDARMAMITHIRNFKNLNNSFDNNKSWRIFNTSDITAIEKRLGNHYLSPFRLTDN